jgi:antitoxin component YwqK of YwqJK toxin-antitoxin module
MENKITEWDGRHRTVSYTKDGVLHQEIALFYPGNRIIQYLYKYINYRRHGDSICYYPDGTIESITPYVGSNQHGLEKYFSTNGEEKILIEWENGRVRSVQVLGRLEGECMGIELYV